MTNNYEDIQQAVEEIGLDGDYIMRALKEFGYSEFPKTGLNELGRNKLITKILEIEAGEVSLIPINSEITRLNKKDKINKIKSIKQIFQEISKKTLKEFLEQNPQIISAKFSYRRTKCYECRSMFSLKELFIKGKVLYQIEDSVIKKNYILPFFEMCMKCGHYKKKVVPYFYTDQGLNPPKDSY